MKQTIAIVHFNTPELTEACILSIRKHGCDWPVVVFDNSREVTWPAGGGMPERTIEAHPFTRRMKGVKVIDNTKGQVIDFDSTLAAFPNKLQAHAAVNGWGSDVHMMTIDKLFDLLPDGFILVESDVLLRGNPQKLWREEYSFCAYVQRQQRGNKFGIGRILPMLCYLNVPRFKAEGVRYFDPERSWMLHPDENDRRNWYDTGASLLEDVLSHRPRLKGLHVDIRPMVVHLGGASYRTLKGQAEWMQQHRKLWEPTPQMRGEKRVAICAIGRNENRYAVEWVEHYKAIGVSKIFVYDNYFGEETPLAETLKKYVDSGFVEIIDIHDRPDLQCRAYEHCYKHHGDEYAWIGFLDFDEYLRWEGKENIEEMFDRYQEGDQVLVNWRLFTDNGLTHYDPRPLKERFTEVMPLDTHVKYNFPENDHVKCFVRGGFGEVRFIGPHVAELDDCRNTRGKKIPKSAFAKPYIHDVMRLDHYWTKTAEEWIGTKLIRGFASGHTYIENFMKQQEAYFFAVNQRTPIKEAILRGEKVPAPEPKIPKSTAKTGKAASKREQSQTGLNSAEREQANQSATIGKPKTAKRTNSKK